MLLHEWYYCITFFSGTMVDITYSLTDIFSSYKRSHKNDKTVAVMIKIQILLSETIEG